MNNQIKRRCKGFTLTELMVVLSIIGLLAGMIIPMINKTMARSAAINCMGTEKALASAVRSYTLTWGGIAPADADTYLVKELGYKLNSEPGYSNEAAPWYDPTNAINESERYATTIKDFRCVVDPAPPINKHGIPQSYAISTSFQGGVNVLDIGSEASKIVMVSERGRRHDLLEKRLGLEANYIFADLHSNLGDQGDPTTIPGLMMRAWVGNSGAIAAMAESSLKNFIFEAVWSRDLITGDALWCAFLDNSRIPPNTFPSNEWNLAYQQSLVGFSKMAVSNPIAVVMKFPINYTVRWDGYLRYPGSGTYEFYPTHDAAGDGSSMELFIESTGMDSPKADPTFSSPVVPAGSINAPGSPAIRIVAAGNEFQYYPFKLIIRGGNYNGAWGITFIRKEGGVIDPNYKNVPLSAASLSFMP